MLSIEQIKEIIPHREPFLMIDKVLELEPGVRAKAVRAVNANEWFFQGHFPDFKVMPGVLIIEAIAQAGALIVLSMPENKGKLAFFGGIKKARFRRKVVPGDQIIIETVMTRYKAGVGIGKGTATVDGEIAAEVEMTFSLG